MFVITVLRHRIPPQCPLFDQVSSKPRIFVWLVTLNFRVLLRVRHVCIYVVFNWDVHKPESFVLWVYSKAPYGNVCVFVYVYEDAHSFSMSIPEVPRPIDKFTIYLFQKNKFLT